MTTSTQPLPVTGASPAAPTPGRWWTLVAVCLGTFMLLVDITIINVALPDIQKQLDASFSDLQWIIDAYALTLASLLLTSGSLADLYGRRKLYILGLGVFTVASLVCGAAVSPLMLIVARGLQGVGGAVMFAVSLALLASAYPGRERGIAFGAWGAVTGLAVAIGPLLGGALTSGLSWRWIFFVNLPLGLAAMALTRAKVSESVQPGARRPDWAGFVTFTAALSLLVFGLIESGEKGWGSPVVFGSFLLTALLLVVFVALESGGRQPMFDLQLFRLPTFVGGSIAAFSLSASLFALQLYLVLYLQDALGYSAFGTGVRLLVLSGGILLTSTIAGRLTSFVPVRLLIGPGLVLVGIALLLMRRIDAGSDWTALIPGLFLAGVGTGLVNPPLASTAVGVVDAARSGMASGINSTFRQVGIATGIATFGSLFAGAVGDEVVRGLAGAPPQASEALSSAITNGAGSEAIAGLPEQLRPVAAQVARESFVFGLREILLIAAVVAVVGGVLALALIRSKDFAGTGGTGGADHVGDTGRPEPDAVDVGADTAKPAEAAPVTAPVARTQDFEEEMVPSSRGDLAHELRGRVEHTDGRPFDGVALTVTGADGEAIGVVHSDGDGNYALPVPPGTYIVIASPPGCQPDARRVRVPVDGDGTSTDFVLDGDGLLYGRVTGATGGLVTLLDEGGSVVAVTDIEDDGSYEVAGLPSGMYTLTAVVPGAAPTATLIEVRSGDAREYDLGLPPADLDADPEDDPQTDSEADPVPERASSPFAPGLHPVAMVRGGTGIAGVPGASSAGNGADRPSGS